MQLNPVFDGRNEPDRQREPRSVKWTIRAGRAIAAALALSWLYATWITTPITPPHSLERAYLEGALLGVLFGSLMGLAVRHAIDATLIACVGIVLGLARALHHTTDITISFWMALDDALHQLRRYDLFLTVLVVASWGAINRIRVRWRMGDGGRVKSL